MKKNYSKPDVMFESFAMSTSIASCAVKANMTTGDCGVQMTKDIFIFTTSASSCTLKFEDGEYNGLCYHVPFDGTNVFNS